MSTNSTLQSIIVKPFELEALNKSCLKEINQLLSCGIPIEAFHIDDDSDHHHESRPVLKSISAGVGGNSEEDGYLYVEFSTKDNPNVPHYVTFPMKDSAMPSFHDSKWYSTLSYEAREIIKYYFEQKRDTICSTDSENLKAAFYKCFDKLLEGNFIYVSA